MYIQTELCIGTLADEIERAGANFPEQRRYKVLREVIDESSKKVLVFVPFKQTIDILTNKLRADGITTEVIRGDVSAPKRTDIFKRFQEQHDPRVLVIQPQSAAHGGAHAMIIDSVQ